MNGMMPPAKKELNVATIGARGAALARHLSHQSGAIEAGPMAKGNGLSVRCVRDEPGRPAPGSLTPGPA
jgi:hypothetical protein